MFSSNSVRVLDEIANALNIVFYILYCILRRCAGEHGPEQVGSSARCGSRPAGQLLRLERLDTRTSVQVCFCSFFSFHLYQYRKIVE